MCCYNKMDSFINKCINDIIATKDGKLTIHHKQSAAVTASTMTTQFLWLGNSVVQKRGMELIKRYTDKKDIYEDMKKHLSSNLTRNIGYVSVNYKQTFSPAYATRKRQVRNKRIK